MEGIQSFFARTSKSRLTVAEKIDKKESNMKINEVPRMATFPIKKLPPPWITYEPQQGRMQSAGRQLGIGAARKEKINKNVNDTPVCHVEAPPPLVMYEAQQGRMQSARRQLGICAARKETINKNVNDTPVCHVEDKEESDKKINDAPLFDEEDECIFKQNILDMFIKEQNCDVSIKVGEREFKAHKCILAARSQVFAAMFNHHMIENRSSVVNIEDCDADTFRDFLQYLYNAKVENISAKKVIQLYPLADKYNMKELTKKLGKFLQHNFSVDTFCDILTLALMYNETDVIKSAEKFFEENAGSILVTVKWQTFLAENYTTANELFLSYTKQFQKH